MSYFSCLGHFVLGCFKYYLHDLCLPVLDHPRYFDEAISKDESDSDKAARQLYVKYLEHSIQILSFMGHYAKMSEFSELLERSVEVFKAEKKDAILEMIKSSEGIQDSTIPLIANTVQALVSLDEKDFRHVVKEVSKHKVEGVGSSERLVSLITGKGSDGELAQELKKLHHKLSMYALMPTNDLRVEIQSSHLAQVLGVTPGLLQRVYFKQLKSQGDHLRAIYLNFKSRKLFTGELVEVSEVQNFMRKACHVR